MSCLLPLLFHHWTIQACRTIRFLLQPFLCMRTVIIRWNRQQGLPLSSHFHQFNQWTKPNRWIKKNFLLVIRMMLLLLLLQPLLERLLLDLRRIRTPSLLFQLQLHGLLSLLRVYLNHSAVDLLHADPESDHGAMIMDLRRESYLVRDLRVVTTTHNLVRGRRAEMMFNLPETVLTVLG